MFFEDPDKESSENEKPSSRQKVYEHYGQCSHSMDECTIFFEDSDEDFSDDETSSNRKKFWQYHGQYSHSKDKCTTLNGLIKKIKSNKSKGYKEGGKKMCTKHKVNVFIEKNLKKANKGKNKQGLGTFE